MVVLCLMCSCCAAIMALTQENYPYLGDVAIFSLHFHYNLTYLSYGLLNR